MLMTILLLQYDKKNKFTESFCENYLYDKKLIKDQVSKLYTKENISKILLFDEYKIIDNTIVELLQKEKEMKKKI